MPSSHIVFVDEQRRTHVHHGCAMYLLRMPLMWCIIIWQTCRQSDNNLTETYFLVYNIDVVVVLIIIRRRRRRHRCPPRISFSCRRRRRMCRRHIHTYLSPNKIDFVGWFLCHRFGLVSFRLFHLHLSDQTEPAHTQYGSFAICVEGSASASTSNVLHRSQIFLFQTNIIMLWVSECARVYQMKYRSVNYVIMLCTRPKYNKMCSERTKMCVYVK